MFDFYPSDFGTQCADNTKYYWQCEAKRCCVLVRDNVNADRTKPAELMFLQLNPDAVIRCTDIRTPDTASFFCDGKGRFISKKIDRDANGYCIRPEGCGAIVDSILQLIDDQSWSFPRTKGDKPYITKAEAIAYEKQFKELVTANQESVVYAAVSVAGVMLANRIGITPELVYSVKHYDSTNTQVDSQITVTRGGNVSLEGKTVVIIDDLISSGRTAQAVIQTAISEGAAKVKFYALYQTIASKEVNLESTDRVQIKSYLPLSNAYWTYGRGFDLTTEESRALPDIYPCTKHWAWETDDDVEHLIKFFTA